MKKLVFTLLLIAVSAITFAQTFNFGVKGGLNMAIQSLSGTSQFAELKNQYKPGLNYGVLVDIGIDSSFSIQPNLSITTKGETLPVQTYNGIDIFPNHATFQYGEASVNFFYNSYVSRHMRIQLGGGLYVAQGLSVAITSGDEKEPAKFSDDKAFSYSYKSLDYGLNFVGGVGIKNFLIYLQYSVGMANISNNTNFPADNIKNRVVSLSVGYLFR